MDGPRQFEGMIEVDDDLLGLLVEVRAFAMRNRLPVLLSSALSTVVSELGTNLLKYARNGRIRVGFLEPQFLRLFVESRDDGPGIPDLELAMQEHFSTGGSLGMGLPGIRRLSKRFHLESEVGRGTRVWCELEP
jgi:serine/threonine-protein kinase RsbT